MPLLAPKGEYKNILKGTKKSPVETGLVFVYSQKWFIQLS